MIDDILYGMVISLIVAFFGCYIFVSLFTDYTFLAGVQILSMRGELGKLIALGAVLDLAVFFALLHYKKDRMAKGVMYGTITLGILTFVF